MNGHDHHTNELDVARPRKQWDLPNAMATEEAQLARLEGVLPAELRWTRRKQLPNGGRGEGASRGSWRRPRKPAALCKKAGRRRLESAHESALRGEAHCRVSNRAAEAERAYATTPQVMCHLGLRW